MNPMMNPNANMNGMNMPMNGLGINNNMNMPMQPMKMGMMPNNMQNMGVGMPMNLKKNDLANQNKVYYNYNNKLIKNLPKDSRLFIGNLRSEKTTKEELASIFRRYGNIYEIVIKSSYGFIQFDKPESCQRAINNENRRPIGGLQIGKYNYYLYN